MLLSTLLPFNEQPGLPSGRIQTGWHLRLNSVHAAINQSDVVRAYHHATGYTQALRDAVLIANDTELAMTATLAEVWKATLDCLGGIKGDEKCVSDLYLLNGISLPDLVRTKIAIQLTRLGRVADLRDLELAREHAEGFVAGVQSTRALTPMTIEALFIAIDVAATMRRGELTS